MGVTVGQPVSRGQRSCCSHQLGHFHVTCFHWCLVTGGLSRRIWPRFLPKCCPQSSAVVATGTRSRPRGRAGSQTRSRSLPWGRLAASLGPSSGFGPMWPTWPRVRLPHPPGNRPRRRPGPQTRNEWRALGGGRAQTNLRWSSRRRSEHGRHREVYFTDE